MMKHMANRFSFHAHTDLRWEGYLSDSVLAIAGIALITGVLAIMHLDTLIPTLAFVYLPLVSLLGSLRGLYAALLTSLLAVLSFDFFLFPPSYTFGVRNTTDVLMLGIFLITAILIGQFPSIIRRRMAQAKSRERELRLLYAQAQEIALLEERQRLARELHDSLAQVLYRIGIEVELAQRACARDPRPDLDSLDVVRALTEAGLAELRALLFELRPESLEQEGLIAALRKQIEVLRARYHLAVNATLGEEPALTLESKHALYRIAQEAFQNIIKHAQASEVTLQVKRQASEVLLDVRDNGSGFDPVGPFPGHLGLRSMRERATNRGGTLAIDSAPGKGTHLSVRIPADQPQGERTQENALLEEALSANREASL